MVRTKHSVQSSKSKSKSKSKSNKKSGNTPVPHIRKKRRFKPGTLSRRRITREQKKINFALQKIPFQRMVRGHAQELFPDVRFQKSAMIDLQSDLESYLIAFFKASYKLSLHDGKRITLMPRDVALYFNLSRGD